MRLVSYASNQVDSVTVNGRQYLGIQGLGSLKAAFKGTGILYSEIQRYTEGTRFHCQFLLSEASPAEYSLDDSGRVSIDLNAQSRLPCSGFVASSGEGYIVGPAFKLETVNGPSIVLMVLAPRTTPYSVSVDKTVLSIPNDDSVVTVTSEGGEIRCIGTISSHAKGAHIILNRTPGPSVFKTGFDETLSQIKGEGQIRADWKPLARSFEELVVAFDPWKMLSGDIYSFGLDRILRNLGALDPGETGDLNDYVLGDGSGVIYTLRLAVDRGLGRHQTDEAKVTVA